MLFSGCSGDQVEPVYPVSGQIHWQGKPLAEATVVFHPIGVEGRSLTARTDANGRFELTTYAVGDGAPAGSYGVTIEYRELVQEGDEKMRTGRNLLPARYADVQTSGLKCEVKSGTNELPVWNLTNR